MSARTLFSTAVPTVAVSLRPGDVSAAAIERRADGVVVNAFASEILPRGAIDASLTGPNIADRGVVTEALRRALAKVGGRAHRVGLVLADNVAKVSLVRLEKVPRGPELEQLIRWHVRKAAPFKIEDAVVTYTPGVRTGDTGREFVVAIARQHAIEEYEAVCRDAGAHAGLSDLATFGLVNALLASPVRPTGDWLLVHVARDFASMAIMRGDDLVFFRNRPENEGTSVADLAHQTAMYYEDRLSGSGFSRVMLVGASSIEGGPDVPRGAEGSRQALEERLGIRVDVLDGKWPRFADRIAAGPALVDAVLPLAGLLLREQVVA